MGIELLGLSLEAAVPSAYMWAILLHEILQAKNELPNMQGALERSHDNQYHLYNVDGYANHITEGAKVVSPVLSHCQQHLCRRTAAWGHCRDGCGMAVLHGMEV